MSSFLLARLPSHSKSLEAVDFMQKNHFSYRISSNFGRLFNTILGDSRLSATIDFDRESEDGLEEKRLIQQLTKIYDMVEVKAEDSDDDDRQLKVEAVAKVSVAEKLVEEVKQEDDDQRQPTLKNDGSVDENQDKEIKEEEPDDYETLKERNRNVEPQSVSATEHRKEGREVKEESIDPDFTIENVTVPEALVENANNDNIEEGSLFHHEVEDEQQEKDGQNEGSGEQVDFPMETYADFDEEEEELIEEEDYENKEQEEDALMDTKDETEDEEEEEGDDGEDYCQEDSEYEEEDEENSGNPADEDVQKGNEGASQRKDVSRKEIKRTTAVFRLLFACFVRNCPSSYKSFEELREHMKIHSGKDNYACDVCKKEFSSLFVALNHIRKRKEKKCCACGKMSANVGKMVEHHRIHTGERPFICGYCKKGFTTKSNLKDHEKTPSGTKPHKCDRCKKKFISSGHLARHMRIHTGSKPFECGECKMRFTQLGHLKAHEMTHLEVNPFKCDDCGRGFVQKKDKINHQRTHTGEKPFACKECDKKFMSKDALRRHVTKKHK